MGWMTRVKFLAGIEDFPLPLNFKISYGARQSNARGGLHPWEYSGKDRDFPILLHVVLRMELCLHNMVFSYTINYRIHRAEYGGS
jgi:hypothetical protein